MESRCYLQPPYLYVGLPEGSGMVRLSGVPMRRNVASGSLCIPARQGRAWEHRCPYGSGVRVPQDSQGWPELSAEVFPRLGAGPAAATQVDLTLIDEYVSEGGAQLLGVFRLRL